jgi:glutamate/tyrosine decarboxylase-like PLP-dependent enzyme
VNPDDLRNRQAALDLSPEQFRQLGHELVDELADFLEKLPALPVSRGETPETMAKLLDIRAPLPQAGTDPGRLLRETTRLLVDHSVFNGHPRFWGYITSSAAPLGTLGDLLASGINPNLGGWPLSPVATEIERQTVRWIAELIGYPVDCGGLLVSGGNMANFIGFLAGRKAKTPWNVREQGLAGTRQLRVYTSQETHTWIHKAADIFGLGTDAIRWIPTDNRQRMSIGALRVQIAADVQQGYVPLMVIGTAGSVSTGAIDPLREIAAIAREFNLWFHVDGAYGGFAAALPDADPELKALSLADSVAVDPHKWLYAPLEAGCALVKDASVHLDTFSYRPPYYHLEDETLNYFEYGLQNSRGFRALKVWLALQQIGRRGYERLISEDIRLTEELFRRVQAQPELEAITCGLSIATFRYVPRDLKPGTEQIETYLNELNTAILERVQHEGEAFVSNAVLEGKYLLRTCIVNFRTALADIEALPEIITRTGRATDAELRGKKLA